MLKGLMLTTAVCALVAATGVEAQTAAPSSPPAMSNSAAPGNAGAGNAGDAKFVTQQGADQFLASKFRGTDVLGPDNRKIGDVSDILFDQSGKVDAFVVSVGGFLGMGSKEVAMAPDSFQVSKEGETLKLKTSLTKDQLKQAANFEPRKPPRAATTGSSGAAPSPGLGGGPRPGAPR